jgi:hypothetical protein
VSRSRSLDEHPYPAFGASRMSARASCGCGWVATYRTIALATAYGRSHRCRTRTPRDTTPSCPDCGWVGTTTTVGLARHAMTLHRCSREQRRREVASRVAARQAADGPRRRCRHKIARHEHGTYAAYVLDRCRCRRCRDANVAIERVRAREIAYGRWQPYIDAQPVREHVARLRAGGYGLPRIARLSGVSHGALWKLVYGKPRADGTCTPSKRVRPATAARLLALEVTLENLGSRRPVDPTGTRRRLQALVALGWSQTELGRRIDFLPGNLTRVIHGPGHVGAGTARKIRALYLELCDQEPPETCREERFAASLSRSRARRHGWLPPIWWDDDTIDDPTQEPAGVEPSVLRRRRDRSPARARGAA